MKYFAFICRLWQGIPFLQDIRCVFLPLSIKDLKTHGVNVCILILIATYRTIQHQERNLPMCHLELVR